MDEIALNRERGSHRMRGCLRGDHDVDAIRRADVMPLLPLDAVMMVMPVDASA